MKIAVLSGKGGTGKTTVSINLAKILEISYVDCDVEEPNGFIFMNPKITSSFEVEVEYPVIDKNLCNLCSACVNVCEFSALASTGKEIVVFEKLCHDCGACKMVCKSNALTYQKRSIGKIESGVGNDITCMRGILDVGEPMAVPVIRTLLESLDNNPGLIDCPPGTSCNVVSALRFADAAILVTEPSAFGFHDLQMAVKLVQQYQMPYGIIINKDDNQNNMIKQFCKSDQIPLLGLIPYKMEAAKLYSNGRMLVEEESYQLLFQTIADKVKEVFSWN